MGARIPSDLWAQAMALAARHGVSKVAATLRLDYAGLKRRLTPLVPSAASPAFVEMMLGFPPSWPGCVLTLIRRAGPCAAH